MREEITSEEREAGRGRGEKRKARTRVKGIQKRDDLC